MKALALVVALAASSTADAQLAGTSEWGYLHFSGEVQPGSSIETAPLNIGAGEVLSFHGFEVIDTAVYLQITPEGWTDDPIKIADLRISTPGVEFTGPLSVLLGYSHASTETSPRDLKAIQIYQIKRSTEFAATPILALSATAGKEQVAISLEQSSDGLAWSLIPPGQVSAAGAHKFVRFKMEGVSTEVVGSNRALGLGFATSGATITKSVFISGETDEFAIQVPADKLLRLDSSSTQLGATYQGFITLPGIVSNRSVASFDLDPGGRVLRGQPVPGPATVSFSRRDPRENISVMVTYRLIDRGSPGTALASSAITIPANSGTWNVSLEQGADLINWEAVAPGSFVGADPLMFFRVNGVRVSAP